MKKKVNWSQRAQKGFLASGIDPADRKGHKNYYIDLLQKLALEEVLELKGDETVLDFGCGSGRISYWIAPRVKKVIGLEVTREMIDLAEKNRTADNVEFLLYDGVNFPDFPFLFDLMLSVGVLQIMKGEALKRTVSRLAQYLKPEEKFYLIEQVSDNPKMGRPGIPEYLHAFEESGLNCLRYYPIRSGRWWLLYLIRYGMIPKRFIPAIAKKEISGMRDQKKIVSYYWDCLFLLQRK